MKNLIIETGDFNVLYSGVVHIISNLETSITIPDIKQDLVLKINFKEDTLNGKPEVRSAPSIDNQTLNIDFINFNNKLDMGNITPARIGNMDDKRRLFLSYRIRASDNKTLRTFEYTFYTQSPDLN